jgi:hypothetical protein
MSLSRQKEAGLPSLHDNMRDLGKTDEVVLLLRHIPHIREHDNDGGRAHGAPWCYFADWQADARAWVRAR